MITFAQALVKHNAHTQILKKALEREVLEPSFERFCLHAVTLESLKEEPLFGCINYKALRHVRTQAAASIAITTYYFAKLMRALGKSSTDTHNTTSYVANAVRAFNSTYGTNIYALMQLHKQLGMSLGPYAEQHSQLLLSLGYQPNTQEFWTMLENALDAKNVEILDVGAIL